MKNKTTSPQRFRAADKTHQIGASENQVFVKKEWEEIPEWFPTNF